MNLRQRRSAFVWYGWGFDIALPGRRWRFLTVAWRPRPLRAYVSRDGTPQTAAFWLIGREYA